MCLSLTALPAAGNGCLDQLSGVGLTRIFVQLVNRTSEGLLGTEGPRASAI